METTRIGKRRTLVIPARLRQRFALREGDLLVTEEREDGILLRPAVAVPVEIYTPERKAEFLLNNAVTREVYDNACRIIRDDFGLNPAQIPHTDPDIRKELPSNVEFDKRMNRTKQRIEKEQGLRRKHA
ncbi:MAG TPA: AbrB/MazE/SpoVT family DNA-binding domain-containing protein [Acidobacteriaceae bacterium]|nr:AbrB/MazE/SpoVT family DNA-binding domain-containing protein [Acidobacteriaceae bacterium]